MANINIISSRENLQKHEHEQKERQLRILAVTLTAFSLTPSIKTELVSPKTHSSEYSTDN
jgi:hypothetical protein